MPALIQFVDSISATPTVRLDVNDATSWFCRNFSAPPPRLRRSTANNAMRDGVHVGSSTYDARTLELELTLIEDADDDFAAQEMQKLWRELDRESNWLLYQPEGLDKPVFFRLFRSDVSALEELWTVPLARTITLELLAEPFALGLKESLGPYTVSNNLAGANGCYFDVAGARGDVAAPVVLWHNNTDGYTRDWLSVSHSTSTWFAWTQAEAGTTLGADTTNPGGGPDAAMSGTGANNYATTSFATVATMAERVRWDVPAVTPRGRYRVMAFVRPAVTGTGVSVQLWAPDGSGAVVAQSPVRTAYSGGSPTLRNVLDLGVVSVGDAVATKVGHSDSVAATPTFSLSFRASGTSGNGLHWDAFALLPADGSAESVIIDYASGAAGIVLDGIRGQVAAQSAVGDPTTGGGTVDATLAATMVGAFPSVAPGVTNRFHLIRRSGADSGLGAQFQSSIIGVSTTVSLAYWPQYLFVRPVSS